MAGVDEAAAALGELDLAAAALGNPIELLQQELVRRFTKDGSPKEDGLRIGALNINSIVETGRREKIETSIQDNKFNIFIVIETKLNYTHSVPTLKGFSYERKDRLYKKKEDDHSKSKTTRVKTTLNAPAAGGILIYIRNNVVYKVKSKGEYAESNVEFLHIEITSPVKLHLVALYSPDKVLVDHVISLMSYFMDPLGKRKIMFIGDTNINRYGCEQNDYLGNTFFDVLSQEPYKVKQLIEQPTHDKACIDQIFTNKKVLESGVMENRITTKKRHKGIYCTIAHSTSDVDTNQVQAALQEYDFEVINQQMGDATSRELIENLMQELSNICNSCILAIVCEFEGKDFAPGITVDGHPYFGWYCCKNKGIYYISVDTVDGMEQKIGLLQGAIVRLHEDGDIQESKNQCIIFTRNSQTNVFHALQKEMWYKDWGQDVVWQPRHVELLDFVLEPSFTHAISLSGAPITNNLRYGEPKELKELKLEESSYRYWSEGGSISRLTV